MQIVNGGIPFNFSYPSFDENAALYVQASIYDVTTGSAVFADTVDMVNSALGIYWGNFTGTPGRLYLVIAVAFIDSNFTAPDPDRAPWSDVYLCLNGSVSRVGFAFATYDSNPGLYLSANLYDVSLNTAVLITAVTMAHVAHGVYFGSYVPTAGKTYLVDQAVYTNNTYTTLDPERSPNANSFQGSVFGNTIQIGSAILVGQADEAILEGQSTEAILEGEC